MVKVVLSNAAGETLNGIPFDTGHLREGAFTSHKLTFTTKILDGAFAGKTEVTEIRGDFNQARFSGIVDSWKASVGGDWLYRFDFDIPHFDDRVRLQNLFDDFDRAFNSGIHYDGNGFANLIEGGGGRDHLFGGGGDDILKGFGGSDYCVGGAGDDWIKSGKGDDNLYGASGADRMEGGNGDDYMIGGRGADVLIGGRGADLMMGDSGKDTYVFQSFKDFGVDNGILNSIDRIMGFERHIDTVDLSGVDANSTVSGNQAFTYLGKAAFSGTAGELRREDDRVYGDTDGDGDADFTFQIGNFAADDFVL